MSARLADYFEAVNGRSASAEEIAQALAAISRRSSGSRNPTSSVTIAAPTAISVEEPVAAPQAQSQRQLPLLKNQSQLLKLQNLLQRQLPQ